jgi:hypothetical protein
MARFLMPRAGQRPRASYGGLRPGAGFGPLQGLVDGPRKRIVNAGSAARGAVGGRIGAGGNPRRTGRPTPKNSAASPRGVFAGVVGGKGYGGMKGHMGSGAGKAKKAGGIGMIRGGAMSGRGASSTRAVKAARGGSRKAVKRLSGRY